MPGSRKLTAQQRLFAHEYLVDWNATQAAIRAGYKEKAAYRQGADLLKKPQIQKIINSRLEKRVEKLTEQTELTVEKVVLELHRILTADPIAAFEDDGTMRPLREWPEDLRRALAGLEVREELELANDDAPVQVTIRKAKFWSKTAASEQLLRKLGAFKNDELGAQLATLVDVLEAARLKRGAK